MTCLILVLTSSCIRSFETVCVRDTSSVMSLARSDTGGSGHFGDYQQLSGVCWWLYFFEDPTHCCAKCKITPVKEGTRYWPFGLYVCCTFNTAGQSGSALI